MKIIFKNRKLENECLNSKITTRRYGVKMSLKIKQRIVEIRAADTVEQLVEFSIGRCHPLHGSRMGEYAVDLVHPFRMVFTKVNGVSKTVCIIEIVDYH